MRTARSRCGLRSRVGRRAGGRETAGVAMASTQHIYINYSKYCVLERAHSHPTDRVFPLGTVANRARAAPPTVGKTNTAAIPPARGRYAAVADAAATDTLGQCVMIMRASASGLASALALTPGSPDRVGSPLSPLCSARLLLQRLSFGALPFPVVSSHGPAPAVTPAVADLARRCRLVRPPPPGNGAPLFGLICRLFLGHTGPTVVLPLLTVSLPLYPFLCGGRRRLRRDCRHRHFRWCRHRRGHRDGPSHALLPRRPPTLPWRRPPRPPAAAAARPHHRRLRAGAARRGSPVTAVAAAAAALVTAGAGAAWGDMAAAAAAICRGVEWPVPSGGQGQGLAVRGGRG